jgi:signal transduction histidine kinase
MTETPDRVGEIFAAIDTFQRTHRLPGLQHAQIRGLLAEHLARVLPAAVAVRPPATDRTALREAVAGALASADGWRFAAGFEFGHMSDSLTGTYRKLADAVLAVLPEPADRSALVAERDALGREADRLRKDWVEMRTRAERAEANRAAVLREAADRYEEILASASAEHSSDPRYYTGVRDVILGLRRMTAEAAVSGRTDGETRASCPDPIECGHEASLGQAQQEVRRLGLMVDEYGAGASALTDKLRRAREMHRETCVVAQGVILPLVAVCGMCEVLDAPDASAVGGAQPKEA